MNAAQTSVDVLFDTWAAVIAWLGTRFFIEAGAHRAFGNDHRWYQFAGYAALLIALVMWRGF